MYFSWGTFLPRATPLHTFLWGNRSTLGPAPLQVILLDVPIQRLSTENAIFPSPCASCLVFLHKATVRQRHLYLTAKIVYQTKKVSHLQA